MPECNPVDPPAPEIEEPEPIPEEEVDCEAQGLVEEDGQCVTPEPELDCESQGMEEQDGQCVMPEPEEVEEQPQEFVEPPMEEQFVQ